ncbi:uncharacterized protein LOC110869947 [Helianthus annuus]|uniref:uncharacterized protein LOC110869947 n=1 Tax=Helianthus annuus TaxID=4232 RepID=UPI000B90A409|nr:uncharacterized protein LOC110869947 [Helianthus annuus]
MNLLSLNIRGFGVDRKVAWIKEIKVREKVSFMAFQETNRSDIPDSDVDRFWGSSGWVREVVNPVGRSGGLLCLWDPGMFRLNSVVKDPNFILLAGNVKGRVEEVFILNVYAPQKTVDKRALWLRILSAKSVRVGLWIVAGDFNVVRGAEERKNSRFKARCARDFNQFIHDADLCDFELKGSKFTFMVEDFAGVVETALVDFCVEGPPDLILTLKLRHLREKIKEWRDDIRTREDEEEELAKLEVEKLEEEMEVRDLTEEEEWVRLEGKKKLLEYEYFKAKDLKQRSRVRWASDGDDNSKFFHGIINKRKASNAIPGLFDKDE